MASQNRELYPQSEPLRRWFLGGTAINWNLIYFLLAMNQDHIPIDQLSFQAYRLLDEAGQRQAPSGFLNLGQWFEAEKFRAFAKPLFWEVMHCPTIKEARLVSARNRTLWRGDWLAVGYRALACGMVYAARSDTTGSDRWRGSAQAVADMLAPLELPERLVLHAANEFIRLRQAKRVAFLGGSAAPFEVVGKRINAVHRKAENAWQLTQWQGRHSSWEIHDWALQQHVPISYLGVAGERLRPDSYQRIAASCDQVVVFEHRKGRAMDAAIKSLRSLRMSVDLDLFSTAVNADLSV